MKKTKLLLPLIGLTSVATIAMPLVCCDNGETPPEPEPVEEFSWDKFVNPDGKDGIKNTESDWEYLLSNMENDGKDGERIEKAIQNSALLGYPSNIWSKEIEINAMVKVNNQLHMVRLIGIDEDKIDNNTKAAMTWEFVNLISDKDGKLLTTYWDRSDPEAEESDCLNYWESSLNKMLNNETGTISDAWWWYKAWPDSSDPVHAEEYNTSVYQMIKTGNSTLAGAIKEVQRTTNTTSDGGETWQHTEAHATRLFIPTLSNYYTENDIEDSGNLNLINEGGPQYSFYKTRILDGDVEKIYNLWLSGTSVDGQQFAKFTASLRAENYDTKAQHWFLTKTGEIPFDTIAHGNIANAIAPCFCI